MQFAPEGFASGGHFLRPSAFAVTCTAGEEAKLPKGYSAYRTADQSISSLSLRLGEDGDLQA